MDSLKEIAKGAAAATGSGAVATAAGMCGLKAAAGAAVPTIMSTTGVVVPGVGTMHGGLTAATMYFAATPVGVPIVVAGAAVSGLVYAGYRGYIDYPKAWTYASDTSRDLLAKL